MFETVDLFEEKDLHTVLLCLFALGRTIQVCVCVCGFTRVSYVAAITAATALLYLRAIIAMQHARTIS